MFLFLACFSAVVYSSVDSSADIAVFPGSPTDAEYSEACYQFCLAKSENGGCDLANTCDRDGNCSYIYERNSYELEYYVLPTLDCPGGMGEVSCEWAAAQLNAPSLAPDWIEAPALQIVVAPVENDTDEESDDEDTLDYAR